MDRTAEIEGWDRTWAAISQREMIQQAKEMGGLWVGILVITAANPYSVWQLPGALMKDEKGQSNLGSAIQYPQSAT